MITLYEHGVTRVLRVLRACSKSSDREGMAKFEIDEILREGGATYADLVLALSAVESAIAHKKEAA